MPEADIFTLFYDPESVSAAIRARHVHASFLNPLRRHYRSLLPLMPMALESFDLREYDLVVSRNRGPRRAFSRHRTHVTSVTAIRRCDICGTCIRRTGTNGRRAMEARADDAADELSAVWDYSTAARVDDFVANSSNVQRRIWKTYRREARVIHPPVAVESFYWKPPEDYYLIVSELVAYKRLDLAVRVFSKNGRRLRVAGDGPEYEELKRMAGPNVEFCGRVSEADLRELYARARAFVMPGEEDFGMTPVEALASGKPVIALRRGGVIDSVPEPGGVFFEAAEEEQLAAAITRFERMETEFQARDLQAYASRFSEKRFAGEMHAVIEPEREGG